MHFPAKCSQTQKKPRNLENCYTELVQNARTSERKASWQPGIRVTKGWVHIQAKNLQQSSAGIAKVARDAQNTSSYFQYVEFQEQDRSPPRQVDYGSNDIAETKWN